MHHEYTRNAMVLPPLICHVFTKQDRVQAAVKKRNDKVISTLAKNAEDLRKKKDVQISN